MVDATTTSVLADVAAWMIAALVLGAGAYQARKSLWPMTNWSHRGKVGSADYRGADAVVVMTLAWLMWMGLRSMAKGEKPESTTEAALRTAGESVTQGPGAVEMLANVVFLLMVCVGLLFYLRQMRGLDPVELFGLRRLRLLPAFGWAVAGLLPLLLVVSVCNWFTLEWLKQFWPDLAPQDSVKLFLENSHWGNRLIMAGAAVIVAPLVEETVFRGFVYGVLKRFTDPIFAAITSSALFALAHFHLGSAVPLFVLALGFVGAYERSGSLLVPMFMHALFNGISLGALIFMGTGAGAGT
jgi:membrane protease YdiL (CAAX protease family)